MFSSKTYLLFSPHAPGNIIHYNFNEYFTLAMLTDALFTDASKQTVYPFNFPVFVIRKVDRVLFSVFSF